MQLERHEARRLLRRRPGVEQQQIGGGSDRQCRLRSTIDPDMRTPQALTRVVNGVHVAIRRGRRNDSVRTGYAGLIRELLAVDNRCTLA